MVGRRACALLRRSRMAAEPAGDEGTALQAAYVTEEREECERAAQTICRVGIPLILGFALFDYVRIPDAFALSLWLRFASAAVFAVLLVALHTRVGRRLARFLALLGVGNAAALVLVIQLHAGTDVEQYSAGLSMVPLTAALILPWRATWSAAMVVLVLAIYSIGALSSGTAGQPYFDSLF